MVYTLQERIDIIFIYGAEHKCSRRTANVFNNKYPGKNLSHTAVNDLVRKFSETGSVINKTRTERRVLDELTQVEVVGQFVMNPTTSLRKVQRQTGISLGSVHKVMTLNKFHPYKIHVNQELSEDDYDRRIQFCEIMSDLINENPDLTKNVCFSDECTFYLNGLVNRHNCRYWSNENPPTYLLKAILSDLKKLMFGPEY